MAIEITEHQVDYWRIQLEESVADTEWSGRIKKLYSKRRAMREEIVSFLKGYLSGEINNEAFRATYDKKTRTVWDGFGLKAMSGAMFLNKLVKHIADKSALRGQLVKALTLPGNVEDGRQRMQGFLNFLEELIREGGVTRQLIQPARTVFFLSSWWHLQSPDEWPIYYESARKVFGMKGVYAPVSDPVKDYFVFRKSYLALESALGTETWRLESLCYWIDNQPPPPPPPPGDGKTNEEGIDVGHAYSHTHIQWLLAKIGRKLSCRIWIAANDHNKKWNNKRLGDFSVKALPSLGMDAESGKIIKMIDVVWLKGANQVVAAFEVELTTSVYSGLLRMSDLTVLSPNLNFPLYIVTAEERLDKVRRELARPTFQTLELHKRCGFFSSEKIVQDADKIMSYATNPAVIERIASKVDDIGPDGLD